MKRLLYISAALTLGLMCSCSKGNIPEADKDMITLAPVLDNEESLTRASLYGDENDLRADLIHTRAYSSGTTDHILDSDVRYSSEDLDATRHQWRFYEQNGSTGSYKSYLWPLGGELDFFAYAPSSQKYVTFDYGTNPPTFTAQLPLSNIGGTENQDNMTEFMYAYTPDWSKSQGPVPLEFKHPFAAIRFMVSQSQRDLTVNKITLADIESKATYDIAEGTWTYEVNSRKDLVLTVGKTIPEDVNFGGELCGTYLVLPQTNEGAGKTLSIECHWEGYDPGSINSSDDTKTLTGTITHNWEASQIYTYTLDLGNSREEILFEVSVTPWDYIYEHVFEIE